MTDKQIRKYIVKNCPSAYQDYRMRYLCDYNYDEPCKDCTDCLIKQVIEKCKKKKEWFSKLPDGVAFDLTTLLGGNLQDVILQLFEIEEFEQ